MKQVIVKTRKFKFERGKVNRQTENEFSNIHGDKRIPRSDAVPLSKRSKFSGGSKFQQILDQD